MKTPLVFDDRQTELCNYYCKDELHELKKICNPLIFKKGVSQMYHDDLYDYAIETLLDSINRYDDSQECQFKTFLTSNIKRTFYDWTRDNHRAKRCNLERDENGCIIRDEKNNVTVIPDMSFDVGVSEEDETTLKDLIASDYSLEEEVFDNYETERSEKNVVKYLNQLSDIAKKIVHLLVAGYKSTEVQEILHITDKDYYNHMKLIRSYENISILY